MRFIYIGGEEFDGESMPASVTVFGIKFIESVPTELLLGMFENDAAFKHAIRKLKTNRFFREMNDSEGAVEIMDAPKAKRGRPARPIMAEEAAVEDAAE